jgi:hypothetical protein
MRENRPYGSEGGEGSTLPDPYQVSRFVHGLAKCPLMALSRHPGDQGADPSIHS